jgi:hypothetical protein
MAQQIKKKYLSDEVISYFDDQINTVEANLAQEVLDRLAADSATIDSLESYIDQEVAIVDGKVDQEILDRIAGDTATLSSANTYTDGEISTLNTSIQSDITGLQTQINNVLSNVDGTALDSLTEIVTAFQAADASLNGAITSLSTGLSADIDAEEAARIAADSALQGEIDAEEIARAAADVTLQNNIDSEASTRASADSALDVRVTALEGSLAPVWAAPFKKDLTSTDISNGYIDLPHLIVPNSVVASVDRLAIHESEDFTVSTVGGVSRITFTGALVSPGNQSLDANDNVFVKYQYLA